MLVLTKKDIQKVYRMEDAIRGDKEALALAAQGKSDVPLRTNINLDEYNGQSLYMPAYVASDNPALGVKIISVYPDNAEKGLPTTPSTMVMVDVETGIVEAVIDGTYLTQLRTGAVQGAATDLLARQDAKIGALIGTGDQASTQLEAMLTVRDLDEVRVMDLDKERAEKFTQRTREKFKDFQTQLVIVDKAEDAVADADIITTVTTSPTATFPHEAVKAGTHINGVGAYTPSMHEIPGELLARADKIIVDTMEGVLEEAGDIITPLKEKLITKDDLDGTLGELVLGDIKGRENHKEITVFKTVGTAVLDIVIGEKILQKARAADVGQKIDW